MVSFFTRRCQEVNLLIKVQVYIVLIQFFLNVKRESQVEKETVINSDVCVIV